MRRHTLPTFAALVLLVAPQAAGALPTPGAAPAPVKVRVDPRVELISIVFHLAGNPEYSQGRVAAYAKAVDEHFAPFEGHAVVQRARSLREKKGISFDAPMKLAVYLDGIDTLRIRPGRSGFPLTEDGDPRWTPDDAEAFLVDLRAFVTEARVAAFLEAQRGLFEAARASLEQAVSGAGLPEWLRAFFGAEAPDAELIACVGLLNGGANYGVSARPAGGRDECYSILGTAADAAGRPDYPPAMLATAAHEFVHSYANRLVDTHMDRLGPTGEKLFAAVRPAMERQAYGSAQTMLRESLVRACVARYLLAKRGSEAAAADIKRNTDRSFFWMDGLVRLLGEYEQSRDRHPSLSAFMPRVVAFFDQYAANELAGLMAEQARQAAEMRAKSPRIVSVVPPNGARDVDPALDAIVVTFDRPMARGNLAVMILQGTFPGDKARRASFDETGRVLTIPAKLKPGTDYEFGLNGEGFMAMRDSDGNLLTPVVIRFRTKG